MQLPHLPPWRWMPASVAASEMAAAGMTVAAAAAAACDHFLDAAARPDGPVAADDFG